MLEVTFISPRKITLADNSLNYKIKATSNFITQTFLCNKIDEIFGTDKMPLCKQAIYNIEKNS